MCIHLQRQQHAQSATLIISMKIRKKHHGALARLVGGGMDVSKGQNEHPWELTHVQGEITVRVGFDPVVVNVVEVGAVAPTNSACHANDEKKRRDVIPGTTVLYNSHLA